MVVEAGHREIDSEVKVERRGRLSSLKGGIPAEQPFTAPPRGETSQPSIEAIRDAERQIARFSTHVLMEHEFLSTAA
jgi:hypothetical protein